MVPEWTVDQNRTGIGGSPNLSRNVTSKLRALAVQTARLYQKPSPRNCDAHDGAVRPEFTLVVQSAHVNWLWINSARLAPAGYQNTSLHY